MSQAPARSRTASSARQWGESPDPQGLGANGTHHPWAVAPRALIRADVPPPGHTFMFSAFSGGDFWQGGQEQRHHRGGRMAGSTSSTALQQAIQHTAGHRSLVPQRDLPGRGVAHPAWSAMGPGKSCMVGGEKEPHRGSAQLCRGAGAAQGRGGGTKAHGKAAAAPRCSTVPALPVPSCSPGCTRQEQPPVSIGTRPNLERAALHLRVPRCRGGDGELAEDPASLRETASIIPPPQSQEATDVPVETCTHSTKGRSHDRSKNTAEK